MAQRSPFDDDDEEREDRFFIAGVDNVGVKRDQYRSAQMKRKIIIAAAIGLSIAAVIGLFLGLYFGLSTHQQLQYECPNNDFGHGPDLIFFVIGDWGRAGSSAQRTAANVMQQVGRNCLQPAFVVSTGDNFYEDGLKSTLDPLFVSSFVEVYTDKSLQVPWYAVLGNHDYGLEVESTQVSLSSSACLSGLSSGCYSPLWQVGSNVAALNKLDPAGRWHCQQGALMRTFLGGQLDILFIDTSPMIGRYASNPAAKLQGGISKQDARAQLAQIESLLAGSQAPWKIVVGHHAVYSFGEHCVNGSTDCAEMQALLGPLLRKYKVNAYLNGHDHDQQLIRMPDDNTVYVVSGAGSKVRPAEFDGIDTSAASDAFTSDDQGFVAVVVRGPEMTFYFYTAKSRGVAFEVTIHQ